ncbi:RAMP superfamily CRISPR-associated protein [Peptostreptococcaceae bacterium AGR-M142]
MYRHKFEMELLSDTTFGSGESKNGVVNTEVLRDSDGFPYLHGKTFKGFLRESYERYLKGILGDEFLNKKFGIAGYKNENIYSKENDGEFKFSNITLNEELKKNIKSLFENKYGKTLKKKDLKRFIEIYLMDDITSTKMDEDGVAKDKSLRVTRVIKKGAIFEGYIETKKVLATDDIDNLELLLKSLTQVGVNKSRGKGLVKITLKSPNEEVEETKFNSLKNEEVKYLFYELKLDEPVKIATSNAQYDYEETKKYISGSAIRGFVINSILNNNEDGNKLNHSQKRDLLKNIYFYNCYPLVQLFEGIDSLENIKLYSFPTPNIYVTTKDVTKNTNIKRYLNLDSEKISNIESIKEGFKLKYQESIKREKEPFVHGLSKGKFSCYLDIAKKNEIKKEIEKKDKNINIDNKCFYDEYNYLLSFDTKTTYKIHHTKREHFENIYRYEALEEDQSFYGFIDIGKLLNDSKNHDDIKESNFLIEKIEAVFKKGTMYIGGSRNSGYGKVRITNLEYVENLEDKLNFMKISDKKSMNNKNESCLDLFYFTDTLLRDKYNNITLDISQVKDFGETENQKDNDKNKTIIISSINKTIAKGFNTKWQSSTPSLAAVENGSCLRIITNENANNQLENEAFDKNILSLGDRKEDGFGLTLINPCFMDSDCIMKFNDFVNYTNFNKIDKDKDSKDDKNNNIKIENIKNKKLFVDAYIDLAIEKTVAKIINKQNDDKDNKNKATKNQLNQFLNTLTKAIFEDENSIKKEDGQPVIAIEEIRGFLKDGSELTRNFDRGETKRDLLNYEIFEGFKIKDFKNRKHSQTKEENIEIIKDSVKEKEVIEFLEKTKAIIDLFSITNRNKELYELKLAKEMLYYKIRIMN